MVVIPHFHHSDRYWNRKNRSWHARSTSLNGRIMIARWPASRASLRRRASSNLDCRSQMRTCWLMSAQANPHTMTRKARRYNTRRAHPRQLRKRLYATNCSFITGFETIVALYLSYINFGNIFTYLSRWACMSPQAQVSSCIDCDLGSCEDLVAISACSRGIAFKLRAAAPRANCLLLSLRRPPRPAACSYCILLSVLIDLV